MTAVEDTVAQLAEQLRLAQEQIAELSHRQTTLDEDPVLLAQRRRGVEGALDAPPKSYPEGARAMDPRPERIKRREMAIAKMQRVAAQRGGVWSPDSRIPRIYGHRQADPQALHRP